MRITIASLFLSCILPGKNIHPKATTSCTNLCSCTKRRNSVFVSIFLVFVSNHASHMQHATIISHSLPFLLPEQTIIRAVVTVQDICIEPTKEEVNDIRPNVGASRGLDERRFGKAADTVGIRNCGSRIGVAEIGVAIVYGRIAIVDEDTNAAGCCTIICCACFHAL